MNDGNSGHGRASSSRSRKHSDCYLSNHYFFCIDCNFVDPKAAAAYVRRMSTAYDKFCPVARTLDIVGERWTMLVVRDLVMLGPRKFQDFEQSLRGISPNTLSARLKRLEDAGIVERRFYEEHPPRAEYGLTESGRELGPALKALADWGGQH